MEGLLNNTFKAVEDITDVHQMTNEQLKQIIQKIEVDKEGNVDIYLRLFGDLGLEKAVLIENECKEKSKEDFPDNKTVPNSNVYT